MSSATLSIAALITYFIIVYRTRDLLAPSATLCAFWFGAASIAEMSSLKDYSLQRNWELETYAAVYLCGLSMFLPGLLQRRQRAKLPINCEPSVVFRQLTTILMWSSVAAVSARLYVSGFSLERLAVTFGGVDIKDELSHAIPGVHYFEILTPFLSLCALFELNASRQIRKFRRAGLVIYVVYSILVYSLILTASRGTLIVILSGALYLYTLNGRVRLAHLLILGALTIGAMSGLSFIRMSFGSMTNTFLGHEPLMLLISPIYTYIAFNFENLNSLVRADTDPTYMLYSMKFLLWPVLKSEYNSGGITLHNFDTLFFNARTFLYPFYHDLGLIGCVIYPGIISLLLTQIRNSARKHPERVILLMGLQKAIWFTFFGNYFFGELVVFVPLLILGALARVFRRKGST